MQQAISSVDLAPKGNYQNLQRYASGVDLEMAADAEATLPFLIEEVRRQMPASRKAAIEARGAALASGEYREQHAGDQGLEDIVLDQPRNRVYITNAGYNRIEIFASKIAIRVSQAEEGV